MTTGSADWAHKPGDPERDAAGSPADVGSGCWRRSTRQAR